MTLIRGCCVRSEQVPWRPAAVEPFDVVTDRANRKRSDVISTTWRRIAVAETCRPGATASIDGSCGKLELHHRPEMVTWSGNGLSCRMAPVRLAFTCCSGAASSVLPFAFFSGVHLSMYACIPTQHKHVPLCALLYKHSGPCPVRTKHIRTVFGVPCPT